MLNVAHFHIIVKMEKSKLNYGKFRSYVQGDQQYHPHLKGSYRRTEMSNNRAYMGTDLKLPTTKNINKTWKNATQNAYWGAPASEFCTVGWTTVQKVGGNPRYDVTPDLYNLLQNSL